MTLRRIVLAGMATALMLLIAGGSAAQAKTVKISEYKLSSKTLDTLRDRHIDRILANNERGTWAPMRMELTDSDLKLMGLPSRKVLLSHRYKQPTAVYPDGRMRKLGSPKGGGKGGGQSSGRAAGPSLVSFAGAGFFGIRPGAFLLLINGGSIGWCSMAHVYGSPGSYAISTAGHCGNSGDVATVVGAVGDKNVFGATVPVLIDFGRFGSSTGDGGVGNDWATIPVDAMWQNLVTPTMAFWGGPIGMYTKTGDLAAFNANTGEVSITPDPLLAQGIVHYGHGTAIGTGGTPRSGTSISWRPNHFMFFGLLTPGDSGSGSNTLTGDTVGANREAAGINTHIYVDPLIRDGAGIMAGTRATKVAGTLANGQILPYPAPVPILP